MLLITSTKCVYFQGAEGECKCTDKPVVDSPLGQGLPRFSTDLPKCWKFNRSALHLSIVDIS